MNVELSKVDYIFRHIRTMVLPFYGNVEHTKKTELSHDWLTHLDIEVETYLRTELTRLYPEVTFVGEEMGGDRSAQKMWLCDPIDGTAHFVRGNPFCSTMLAYIEDGQVMMGIIYDFVNDKIYHATRGKGAYCEGTPLHVSQRPLRQSFICMETNLRHSENVEPYLTLFKKCIQFQTINAGYEFILCATGKIEGRICRDPIGKDYDYAAGSLLVSEAGGMVTNIGKETFDYRDLNILALNPVVYQELTSGADAIFPLN